ncbi:hypothetical protein PY257_09290 [Ramlibacter sp. H39-3-26]|uniref:hypothetical protein n=1 Tax=Curvibacter soli TaxID=3031331 RepID=UPI0023D9CC6A|nr:hypothetical protein [Ramlibacter sp. H39-3-26]MDF1485370.1 hypothetical protein [Ramlibacter sp. H39-3-26]
MNAPRNPCDSLGVCQARTPACSACQHDTERLPANGFFFAPGVIEGGDSARRRDTWARAILIAAALAALAAALGFAAGWIDVRGFSL